MVIAVIRISGLTKQKRDAKETLFRLRLRRKYVCVILPEKNEILGMVKKVRNHVAFGKIDKEILKELIEKRGKTIGNKKIEPEKIASEIIEGKVERKLSDFGVKDFFRLHPPRGGIDSKKHFPKGVLGNHKEKISELIRRML